MIYFFSIVISAMGVILSTTFAWFHMETMLGEIYVTRFDMLIMFMSGALTMTLLFALITLYQAVVLESK